ncbi:FAD-binding oxidoreductase [Pigmentiphaga aceris]|uniref:FAD-binding oxidoreductase n=1 Tax=Pigmentiphaga aceris TaxID=1940612 RepID=A0A5C0AX84_9BURK|nr:FAD-binding oxidoreductase [Pigmentiphaga aceris]QEI06396.1 FAD-binding oxidoreductase [Pigmentiphaga aceris]
MTIKYTKKYHRDLALFNEWEKLNHPVFEKVSLEEIKAAQTKLQGHIVFPTDPLYNQDRKLFNPVFNPLPYMIIYCAVEADVAIALQLAKNKLNIPFTVRSSGHCTAGFSAGFGALIDVSALNDATVDPVAQIATVGAACPFRKLDPLLDTYKLHVPGGECPDVCLAGYMQGGGYGFTSVTYGMNCDNVIDMRVMLADGTIVTASPTVNSDLYWAMRGGTGGNFGILLTARLQLRPLGDVFGWALIWPLQTDTDFQNGTDALMLLQSQYMLDKLPKELNIQVSLCYQPGIEAGLPVTGPQYPYLMVRGVYVGTQAAGQAAIQPLCNLPGAVTQWTKVDSFVNLNGALLDVPYGLPCLPNNIMPYEDKACRYVTRELTSDEWNGLLRLFVTSPNWTSYFYMEFYGGAINAFPAYPAEGSNAFVHRTAAFNAVLDVFWYDGKTKEQDKAASEKFLADWINYMAPMWNGEIYQNYPQVGQTNYGQAYWGDAQAGLYAVKQKYDPTNAFRFAQDVNHPTGPLPTLPAWLQTAVDQKIDSKIYYR